MKKSIRRNILGLLFVFFAMAAAAIMRDGRLLGHSTSSETEQSAQSIGTDGSITINTSGLPQETNGYAGPVPVEIHISQAGVIDSVTPLENSETPGFFKRVTESGLPQSWNGLTPAQALEKDVDAVSGATYSSSALIANVRSGLQNYLDKPIEAPRSQQHGLPFYAALFITLCASVIPLFYHNKTYRTVQQLVNVGVLGFWTGTFIDYTAMLGLMSGGITASASVVTLIMLAVALLFPLFGKHGHYCAWVCPLGSLQELAAQCNTKHRLKLGKKTVAAIKWCRTALWTLLMLALWTGFLTSWIDYELFTAFMIHEAATSVLIAGGAFIALSFFIPRPYCRFVCPTGFLFKLSENIDSPNK